MVANHQGCGDQAGLIGSICAVLGGPGAITSATGSLTTAVPSGHFRNAPGTGRKFKPSVSTLCAKAQNRCAIARCAGGVTGRTVIVDRTSSLLREKLGPFLQVERRRVRSECYVSIARE